MAGRISRQPGDDPDTIHWRGDQREDLPSRLSDIPEAYRHTPRRYLPRKHGGTNPRRLSMNPGGMRIRCRRGDKSRKLLSRSQVQPLVGRPAKIPSPAANAPPSRARTASPVFENLELRAAAGLAFGFRLRPFGGTAADSPPVAAQDLDPCRWADSPALHLAVGVETMVVGQLDSPSFGQGVPLVAGHWAPGETGIGRDNISRVNGGSARRPVRS